MESGRSSFEKSISVNLPSQPAETLPVATLRNGKIHVEYEIYQDPGQPHRLEVRRGRRYLLEIFDQAGTLPATLATLLEMATDPARAPDSIPLSGMEKFLCFVFGRGAEWSGAPASMPERTTSVETPAFSGSRHAEWRVVRLKGWGAPKVLLLVRTTSGGHTAMGANSTTKFHSFPMSLPEAAELLRGLGQLKDHPSLR